MSYNAFRYHAIYPNKVDEMSLDEKKDPPILTPLIKKIGPFTPDMESCLFLKRRREGEYSSHLLAFKYSNNIKSQTNIADGAIVSTMLLSDQFFRTKHFYRYFRNSYV